VAQICPRALGSLSVASYDSQGYGGGILSRLHTGSNAVASGPHYINLLCQHRNHRVLFCCVTISCRRNVLTVSLPRNGLIFLFYHSGFEPSCYNIFFQLYWPKINLFFDSLQHAVTVNTTTLTQSYHRRIVCSRIQPLELTNPFHRDVESSPYLPGRKLWKETI
jgi:hypothetical protein